MAEEQRFELWRTFILPVFKTGAIDHSAIPPQSFMPKREHCMEKEGIVKKFLERSHLLLSSFFIL
ncbi:MAG: hypothetical protein ACD_78C00294G0001, partial [uncultured bacterium (gcode 4)]